jgi:hypothetical protein
MNRIIIIRLVIIILFLTSYFFFTIRQFRIIKKNILYTNRIKMVHLIMIWLVPFVWALLLVALSKSAPGSYEVAQKVDPEPFSRDGGTAWTE